MQWIFNSWTDHTLRKSTANMHQNPYNLVLICLQKCFGFSTRKSGWKICSIYVPHGHTLKLEAHGATIWAHTILCVLDACLKKLDVKYKISLNCLPVPSLLSSWNFQADLCFLIPVSTYGKYLRISPSQAEVGSRSAPVIGGVVILLYANIRYQAVDTGWTRVVFE